MECLNYKDASKDDYHVCRGCLTTNCVLYDLCERNLEKVYSELTGLTVLTERSHRLVCVTCLHLLHKFGSFRVQCLQADHALQQFYHQNVMLNSLKWLEYKPIKSNLVKSNVHVINIDPCKEKENNVSNDRINNLSKTQTLHLDFEPKNNLFTDGEDFRAIEIHHHQIIHEVETCFIKKDDYDNVNDLIISENGDSCTFDDGNIKSSEPSDDDDNYTISDLIRKEKYKTKNKKYNEMSDSERKKNTFKWVKAKRKRKDDENDDRKYKVKKIKVNKEFPEDKQLVKQLAERFKNVWRWNGKTHNKMDIYGVFETIYKESIAAKDGKIFFTNSSRKHGLASECMQQEMNIFLDLTRKLSEVYNMEVVFLSVEQQKREIEEKKKSAEYRDARYKCEICCKTFNFPDTSERHSLAHKEYIGGEECAICLYRFKRRTQLMSHLHTMHEKKLKCRECGVVVRTWLLAKEHYQGHSGITTVCKLCNKSFNEKKLYYMHLRNVHKEEIATAPCALCRDSFNGRQGLRMHMDRAHKQAAQCTTCEGWFHNSDALEAHLTFTNGACQPGHSCCPLCGATFATEELMQAHHDEMHKQDYRCEQCNKSFASVHSYKWHVTQRHGNAASRAARSGKATKRVRNDKWKKNFVCDVCGKNDFPFLSCLKQHQRKHRGEKPFQCGDCRKQFTELDALKVHSLSHTGERRHQCPYCPKTFRQKGNRDMHVLTHTKEKAHSCPACFRMFSLRSNMIKHLKTVHEGHPLPPTKRRSSRAIGETVADAIS